MGLEIQKVQAAQNAQQTSSTAKVDKKEQEKEKVNNAIKTALIGSKSEQEKRQSELQTKYQNELGLTEKEAEKAAKNRVADEIAGKRIATTTLYFDKEAYDEAKKLRDEQYDKLYDKYRAEGKKRREARRLANAEAGTVNYIKNKKVREFVNEHQDKFFDENGKFNQENYVKELKLWSGDNKLDLSESRAAGDKYYVKAKTVRKAADYANFDVQKDKTALKRFIHVAESGAIGAGLGSAAGAILGPHMKTDGLVKTKETFVSNVIDKTTGEVIDHIVTERPVELPVEDKIGAKRGAGYGALIGGVSGIGVGLATMHKVKDQGEKDVLNGIAVEEIVKNGPKGVDGIDNAKILAGIIKMDNLTQQEKIDLLKKHYGENTGKRVTQRELLAAYEEAKRLAAKPNENPLVKPDADVNPTIAVNPNQNEHGNTGNLPPVKENPFIKPEADFSKLPKLEVKFDQPCEVVVQNGESISALAKKYGVSEKQIIELNKDQLKTFKNAKDCDDNKTHQGFLVGAKIKVLGGCDKADQNKSAKEAQKDYNEMVKKHFEEYCPEHQVYSKAFENMILGKKKAEPKAEQEKQQVKKEDKKAA